MKCDSLKQQSVKSSITDNVKTEEVDSAFIEEDSGSFIALSPSVHPDDYLFSLDDSEGIADLFDINATALPHSEKNLSKRLTKSTDDTNFS